MSTSAKTMHPFAVSVAMHPAAGRVGPPTFYRILATGFLLHITWKTYLSSSLRHDLA